MPEYDVNHCLLQRRGSSLVERIDARSSFSSTSAKNSASTCCSRPINARTVAAAEHEACGAGLCPVSKAAGVGPLEPLALETGERLEGEVKYYDYGVASVIYQLPFSGDWEQPRAISPAAGYGTLISLRVSNPSSAEAGAREERDGQAVPAWLSEDYFIFHVREAAGCPIAAELARDHGAANRAGRPR